MLKLILSTMLLLGANAIPLANAHPHKFPGRAAILKNAATHKDPSGHFKRAHFQQFFSQQHRITSQYRSMFMRPDQNYQELWTQYKTKNDEIMKNIEHAIEDNTPSK